MEWFLSASLIILSLILLIKQGLCQKSRGVENGIMCYVCNSDTDPRCGHPFKKHYFTPVNCSDLNYMDEFAKKQMLSENKTQPNLCRKNYQTVTLGGKTDTRIVRNCGYMSKKKPMYGDNPDEVDVEGEDRCFRRSGTFEVMVTYCTCITDECNGASQLGSDFLFKQFLTFPLFLLGITSLLIKLPAAGIQHLHQ